MKDNLKKTVELIKKYRDEDNGEQLSFHLGYACACLQCLDVSLDEPKKVYFRGILGREKWRNEDLVEQVIRISEEYLCK